MTVRFFTLNYFIPTIKGSLGLSEPCAFHLTYQEATKEVKTSVTERLVLKSAV